MSKIKVNSIEAATGSTITIPSGQTLDISSTTLTLPSTVVTTTGTQTLTNKTIGVSQLSGTIPTTIGGTGLTTLGSASQVLRVNSGATALEFGTVSGTVFGSQLFHVKDERASGTNGQSLTGNNTWTKRDINTTATNEITSASVSSSVISLPAGTYFADGFIQSRAGVFNSEKGRIRNTTDGTTLLVSNGGYSWTSDYMFSILSFKGRFTLSGTKNIEIQWISGTGSGTAESIGFDVETYLSVCFWKIS